MRRGDLVVISGPGDCGKPRPAVVVQSDRLSLDSVLVAQITSEIVAAPLYRLTIEPGAVNGLQNVFHCAPHFKCLETLEAAPELGATRAPFPSDGRADGLRMQVA